MDPLKLKKEFERGLLATRYESMQGAYCEWVRLSEIFKRTGRADGVNEAHADSSKTLSEFNGVALHKLKKRFGSYKEARDFRTEIFKICENINDDNPGTYFSDDE